MSYTNQTKNYGLPQYVGTDVPAWLTDVNGAFATIDQGMNAAKTQADSAATAAGQAANDIMSINSTLGTQAGQISAAAGAAAAAQTTANDADGKADTNAQNIAEIDGRVTALEKGGAGDTKETITITNTYYATIPPKTNMIPYQAVIKSSNANTNVVAMISNTKGLPNPPADYTLLIMGLTSGATPSLTAFTGTYTVDVFYKNA